MTAAPPGQTGPPGPPREPVPPHSPSVGRLFLDRVAATPDREAYRYPAAGGWASLTWAQASERVGAGAAALIAAGLQRGERVGILCATRVEWILVDTAVMCAGGATTTVYPSTPAAEIVFILADAGCRVVLAETQAHVDVLRAARNGLPDLLAVVTLDGAPTDDGWVIGYDAWLARGREHLAAHPTAVDDAVAAVGPDDLATLIYTSGTTGRPKGVRLTHDCWTYEAAAIDALGLLGPDDVQYLWLPLSHAFGKVMSSAHIGIGFVTAVNGDISRLVDDLAEVRPTFMAAAPRVFEKVHNRVVGQVKEDGGAKLRVFTWALGVGRRVSVLSRRGQAPGPLLAAQHALADRLVFAKVRARFGGRIRYFVSGSAALSEDIAEFFHAMGILVLEGYGLTETSGSIFVNRPGAFRFGTVGIPLPGMRVRTDADGEVLVAGPAVMRGYHGLPRDTEAALTADGWLRTGDIGEIAADGFLRITDRKKDLLKTSSGKYVAPQPIEVRFKALCRYASQMLVYGDGRNFCSALVTLDADEIAGWAAQNGVGHLPYEQVVADPRVTELVAGCVDQLNATLARWETIKRFAVLPRDLDVEHGELTPSLKVKRRVVERNYRDVLDAMYDGARTSL